MKYTTPVTTENITKTKQNTRTPGTYLMLHGVLDRPCYHSQHATIPDGANEPQGPISQIIYELLTKISWKSV